MAIPAVNSVTLPGGLTLEYLEQGDPAGVPVLLLHGYADSCRSYSEVLSRLPGSMHVLSLTQRGHGDSNRPESGYQMEDFAEDAVAFMDALGIESAILVGHSMGAAVATLAAALHPERVAGLVLIGAIYTPLSSNPDFVELWEGVISTLEDPVDPEFVREFQTSTLVQPVPQGFVDMIVSESLKVPARVLRDALQGTMAVDVTDRLDAISAPTLLVWGERDAMIPRADQDALVAGISGSRLAVYPGAGHGAHWEDPERFARDLAEFFETVTAAG